MKKNIIKTFIALSSTLVLVSDVTAGDIGVAIGIGSNSTQIRADFNINDSMRLEPFGSVRLTDLDTDKFELGLGFHMLEEIKPSISAYYGAYVGFLDDYPNTMFTVGPVAGVEYAFDSQFTLGPEVRVDFACGDTTDIRTNSSALLRYYF